MESYFSKKWVGSTQTVGYNGVNTVFFTDLEGKKASLILELEVGISGHSGSYVHHSATASTASEAVAPKTRENSRITF